MTLINKRSRMVSIRLSDDEFRKLHEVCATTGARSISDLARDAMHKLMANGVCHEREADGVCERLQSLDERVTQLQQEMTRLASLVGVTAMGEGQ